MIYKKNPAHNILVTASSGKYNILSFHHLFLLWYQLLLLSAFTETQWSLLSLCDGCDRAAAYALLSALRCLTHLPAVELISESLKMQWKTFMQPCKEHKSSVFPLPVPGFSKCSQSFRSMWTEVQHFLATWSFKCPLPVKWPLLENVFL